MHLGALPPAFAGLSPEDAHDAAATLESAELESGEVLMEEGEEDFTLAFLVTGHVTYSCQDVRIGGAASRDMIGEIELFGQIPRSASVVAAAPTQVLVMAHERFLALSEAGNAAVYNIERFAHRRLAERFRHFGEGIAERSSGIQVPQPAVRTPGFMERLQKMMGGSATSGAVDVLAVLQRSPMFDWADVALLALFAPSFRAERVVAGAEVVRAGQINDRAYVIVEGHVDMYFPTGEHAGDPVARLGVGDAFGDATLPLQSPSAPSFFAATDAVLLSIGRDHFVSWFASDEPVGSVFRQGFLKNLVRQVLSAQGRYVELEKHLLAHLDDTFRGTPIAAIWRD